MRKSTKDRQDRELHVLRRLAQRALSAVDMDDEEIKTVLWLTKRGLAWDFSAFKGTRSTRVELRIWGITAIGRAVLEQQALIDTSTQKSKQLNLIAFPTHPSIVEPRRTTRIKPLIRDPKPPKDDEPPF